MKIKIISFIISLLSVCPEYIIASNRLNLLIEIPANINPENVKLLLDNGFEQKFVLLKFNNNKAKVTEEVDAVYTTINLLYPDDMGELYGMRVLVNATLQSKITFKKVSSNIRNKLSVYTLKNGIDITNCKENLKLKAFCKDLLEKHTFYSKQYNENKGDSILNLYNLSSIKLAEKEMEFIKSHGNQYFYFWHFRLNVVNVLLRTHQLELYETFNSAFPQKFKESNEGKNLKALIAGNIFIKKGNKSPVFDVVDYKGNKVISEIFLGKYVLINFWATWCAPCIAEIPILKKIRNDYSENKLEMISVSYDRDSTAFIKGIKSYGLNWINVFSNTNFQNLFGKKPIPSVYLIDPNGNIAFSSWEDNMDKLHEILKTQLDNVKN